MPSSAIYYTTYGWCVNVYVIIKKPGKISQFRLKLELIKKKSYDLNFIRKSSNISHLFISLFYLKSSGHMTYL